MTHGSAGENDGAVIGTCAWQPTCGQVDGALAFDGTTSIVAHDVLNPSDGSFGVLAWIKGGSTRPGDPFTAERRRLAPVGPCDRGSHDRLE